MYGISGLQCLVSMYAMEKEQIEAKGQLGQNRLAIMKQCLSFRRVSYMETSGSDYSII